MDNIGKNDCTFAPNTLTFDEKRKKIVELLPGSDCGGFGGCGRKSCSECADAIAEGASIALCPACTADDVKKIASIMGTAPVEVRDDVAFISCNGSAAGKKRFAKFESCEKAFEDGFLPGECQYGCMGVGSCIERCKFDAMSVQDGAVIIDKEKCNGCGACLGICPQELIRMIPREATNFIPCASQNDEETTRAICGHGCIGCKDCEEACPEGAVKVINNCAVIDYDKCVGCVACTVKCRKKIIIDDLHDLRKLKDKIAFVKCKGGYKANKKFTALGLESCKDATKVRSKGMGICQSGCTGLGDCTKVCRYDAISVVNGTAVVDPEKCVGCLDCVHACPNNIIVEVPYAGTKQIACSSTASRAEKTEVCGVGCIGCGDCAANCPNGAISIQNSCAVIDTSLCENCFVCTYMCSQDVLKANEVSEANYLQRKALGLR